MSERNMNLGALRSKMELELHTTLAYKLFFGRRKDDVKNTPAIPGLVLYLHKIGIINSACREDDPFADWTLLQVEAQAYESQLVLGNMQREIEKLRLRIPKQFSVSENLSVRPVRLPLFGNNPLSYQGIFLLISLDCYIRDAMLLRHIGLLGKEQYFSMADRAAHEVRTLFAVAQNYLYMAVTRDDLKIGNARAQAAITSLGLPPSDILDGTRRSQYAPLIRKRLDNSEKTPDGHLLDEADGILEGFESDSDEGVLENLETEAFIDNYTIDEIVGEVHE